MAKKSHIARDKKRLTKVAVFGEKRKKLRLEIIKETDYDKREALSDKLNGMSRDSSSIRVRGRCQCCGRPRGVYRKFGLCRLCLRGVVLMGMVPGVRKASW